ncbi:MAG TPA: alkaline phosphatase family protein [Vicinamibacterales bacterium]|nr:alkaline phosphatase family protein [Vicinamibacterales bacterium]
MSLAMLLAGLAVSSAATVGPAGYTNAFPTLPGVSDWASASRSGGTSDAYDADADVQTNITAALVATALTSNASDPAAASLRAIWSSTGLYVQTRPTGNRYTALMGKFVNASGSNASAIAISYKLTFAGTTVPEEPGRGTRVYYSLSGQSNSWINLPALSTVASNGTVQFSTNVTAGWLNGGSLYVLFVDDNGSAGTDVAVELDDFSIGLTPAPPSCTIIQPTNGFTYGFHRPVTLEATADPGSGGPTLTGIAFYEVSGGWLASVLTAPYTNSINFPVGTYSVYAVATNSLGASLFSQTNTFFVVVPPTNTVPPTIASQSPVASGTVSNLTSIQVTFSERVFGVDAADLRVNGAPATGVSGSDSNYVFTFAQPPFGTVTISFAPGHGITDTGYPTDLPFDENGAGASWTYSLIDVFPPTISARGPAANALVTNLAQISVTFSEPVAGADAADLLVNGGPASGIIGAGSNFIFSFAIPGAGPVAITWAGGHGITDLSANAFNPATAGHTWFYTNVDQIPPIVLSQSPVAGSFVPLLNSITVTFSESVSGVNAGDLRVNGSVATTVSGGPASYTFTVPLLNDTNVNITWSLAHGITDLNVPANPFNATGPGATWSYSSMDNAAPRASVFHAPSNTVRSLTHINVTFNEPVTGVDAGDLLVNGLATTNVSGSGAGPYLFTFPPPPTGAVAVAWAAGHAITDVSPNANAFAGGAWGYVHDPSLIVEYTVSHVVQMSLDGMAAVHLQFYVTNAPGQFPNFVRLINEGAWTMNARCDADYSETVPNHSTMFMARPVLQPAGAPDTTHHGYFNNFPTAFDTFHNSGNTNVAYKASMMDVAHDYGRSTALYTGKTRLDICDRSYNATNGALDLIGTDNGRDKIDFSAVADISGTAISNEVNTLLGDLTNAAPKAYSFIHIAEPDLTGHSSGWGSANWSNAVRNVDREIGRILNAIDANPVLSNQTALIVTADHGGGGVTINAHTEAYHITNYTIPFFVRAPGIPPGANAYSIFNNRGSPGTNRTDYNTQPQPIRNADASNLALSFLGLPPIPGSFIVPALNNPANTLRVARNGTLTTVFWYDPNNDSVLESAAAFASPTVWSMVTDGIVVNETTKTYSVPHGTSSQQIFRVRTL